MRWISVQNLIGGLALGFEKTFGPPCAIVTNGIVNDRHYLNYTNEIRKLNIPVINASEDYTELSEELSDIDMVVMTPFCSGLSQLNTIRDGDKGRNNPENCQNQNMYNLTRLALSLNPKVIVFENAPALFTASGSAVLSKINSFAKEKNYGLQVIKTNTNLHGIPQNRKRTFVIMYRDSNPAVFNFENVPYRKFIDYVQDDLGDVQADVTVTNRAMDPYTEFLFQYVGVKEPHKALMKFLEKHPDFQKTDITRGLEIGVHLHKACTDYCKRRLEETGNGKYQTAINKIAHAMKKYAMKLDVYDASSVFAEDHINALIGKNIGILHPTEQRGLNVRELLHLMGFPKDFPLINRRFEHITQNVPVCTANYVARNVKDYLDGNLEIAKTRFLKQDNITQKIKFVEE